MDSSATAESPRVVESRYPKQHFLGISEYDAAVEMESKAISTMALYANWTTAMSEQLKNAVCQLTLENPFLTGRLQKKQDDETSLVVEAGVHTDLFVELPPYYCANPLNDNNENNNDDYSLQYDWGESNHTLIETIQAAQTFLEPIFLEHSIGSSKDCLRTGGPLFRVMLLPLVISKTTAEVSITSATPCKTIPNMALCIELCHLMADGASRDKFVHYLDCYMNGRPLPSFVWKKSPEDAAIPPAYSEQDRKLHIYGWIPGYQKKAEQYAPSRVAETLLMNPQAVEELKEDYRQQQSQHPRLKDKNETPPPAFVSTNDLITAAMCELLDPSSICGINADMRGRLPHLEDQQIGNLQRAILFPAGEASGKPAFVRTLQRQWAYYGTNTTSTSNHMRRDDDRDDATTTTTNAHHKESRHLPADQMEACELALISNWTAFQHILCPPGGARVVCECPMKAYVENALGMDIAFVFQADPSSPGTLMFISNFTAGKRGQELKDRIQYTKLFQKVFETTTTSQAKVGG